MQDAQGVHVRHAACHLTGGQQNAGHVGREDVLQAAKRRLQGPSTGMYVNMPVLALLIALCNPLFFLLQ